MPEIWQIPEKQFVGDWEVVAYDDELERAAASEIEEWNGRWRIRELKPLEGHPNFFTWKTSSGEGVLLLHRDAWGDLDLVGGYVHETLWLDPSIRRRGISPLLVVIKADMNGGQLEPVTYTPAGRAAHVRAHKIAVARAKREGYRIPE